MNARKELAQLEIELNQVYLERNELIRLMLTSMLAKSNGFAGGPPGTGKTSLAKSMTQGFSGRCFYRLMDSTTTPDEIIGAVDLKALTDGDGFKRDLTKGLVTADMAILDEGFKANSPCLNAILGIILDHEYNNGCEGTVTSPLKSLWVCSNELPQDESLAAFWDRLLVRFWVTDVSRPAKRTIMMRQAGLLHTPPITVKISQENLIQLQQEAIATPVEELVIEAILNVTDELEKELGTVTSTRKHNQLINLIRCYAYVCGDSAVDEEHLDLLENCLWSKPEERGAIKKALKQYGNPLNTQATSILDAAKQIFNGVPPRNGNKGQWIREMGTVQLQLEEMEEKLSVLIANNQNSKPKRLKKVEQASCEVSKMQLEIQNMIATAYSLPTK